MEFRGDTTSHPVSLICVPNGSFYIYCISDPTETKVRAVSMAATGTFHYVIVGGGAAGLLLATRLSEDPEVQVLVLEAGEDLSLDPRVNVPAMWTQLCGSSADWRFKTSPQKALGGRQMEFSQGRLLGGSAALNTMLFILSAKSNLDQWAGLGNEGWDWDSLGKSLNKVYNLDPSSAASAPGAGPISISIPDDADKWAQVWRESIAGLGLPVQDDPLGENVLGAVTYPESVDPKTKVRSYVVSAYLAIASSRPNLTVRTSVQVDKVLFDLSSGGEPVATGVEYTLTKDGEELSGQVVTAHREVILSAGAINTPRILELSGVGDKARLETLGIPVVVDNPSVGENLQNHVIVPLSFEVNENSGEGFDTVDGLSRQDPTALAAAAEAYGRQTGPLSRTNSNVQAQVPFPHVDTDKGRADLEQVLRSTIDGATGKSDYEQAVEAYVQSVLESPTEASAVYLTVTGWASYNPDGSWAAIPEGNEKYFSIPVMLAHPLSRGSVHVTRGPDHTLGLDIDPAYLSHPLDIEVLARHVRLVESVLAADTSKSALASHLNQSPSAKRSPGLPRGPAAFGGHEADGEEQEGLERARSYVRGSAVGAFHWTSSCAMLPRDKGGVVDPRLRVYGARGLRVVDASIFPLITRANTMATVYAVAERAAEIIKAGQ
ncbi:hypothetical protein KVR01_007520 [Diaporthe batatas]|uniref:uncharacterized protein n=1 Tax=Diaporthe batatas TaxID=748121 RepID=UPI001D046E8D|nr:uncharacterized protein KVR01_007520 [Diaporthe batatas]KAG8163042.1 hypothetical protein KVR01_007520 [Diaporthe batatas]